MKRWCRLLGQGALLFITWVAIFEIGLRLQQYFGPLNLCIYGDLTGFSYQRSYDANGVRIIDDRALLAGCRKPVSVLFLGDSFMEGYDDENTPPVGRQVVLHDADARGLGIMDIDEFAHAVGVVFCRPPLGDPDLAPGPMHVDADEEIDGAVAAIFAIVAFELARLGRDRLAHLADELDRANMNGALSTHQWPTKTIGPPRFRRSAMSATGECGHSTGVTSVANDVVDDARSRHRMCQRVIVEQRITRGGRPHAG